MRGSGLPISLGCRGNCEPPGRIQVHTPNCAHVEPPEDSSFGVFKASKWIFSDFSDHLLYNIIYKEFIALPALIYTNL